MSGCGAGSRVCPPLGPDHVSMTPADTKARLSLDSALVPQNYARTATASADQRRDPRAVHSLSPGWQRPQRAGGFHAFRQDGWRIVAQSSCASSDPDDFLAGPRPVGGQVALRSRAKASCLSREFPVIKRARNRRVMYWLAGSAVVAALFVFRTAPSAQSGYVHLNPVVEALSQGRHVFGVSTSDLSMQNAVALAGNPNLDYVYLDMEHNPLRFQEMKHFLAFITAGDKAGIIKRGNGQVRPAVFARFPPYGREQRRGSSSMRSTSDSPGF